MLWGTPVQAAWSSLPPFHRELHGAHLPTCQGEVATRV